MSFSEYDHLDGTALAELVRARKVTPAELLNAAIERIETLNPRFNAVVHKAYDQARKAIEVGLPQGPFTGVPFLLKDMGTAAAGVPLTLGSRLFDGMVPQADSTLAARYRLAGLVLVGRTNTPEFALSFSSEPEMFGPAINPWEATRTPGGSSGGAAVAVAVGMVPLAHASDGAGSTRIPASHCGLFGFKPTRLRNPLGPDLAEILGSMSTPHCVSRSVRDNAILLDASAGPDIGDPYAAPPLKRPLAEEIVRDPAGQRIGLILHSPLGTPVDDQCVEQTRKAAAFLETLGHRVEEANCEYDCQALKKAWRVVGGVVTARMVDARGAQMGVADPLSLLEPVNREWVEEGRRLSGADYLTAIDTLHRTGRALGRFFQKYDIFMSPTVAEIAPALGEMASSGRSLDAFYDRFWSHGPFTCAFNASGGPAMSVPLGKSSEGLPIGVHFGADLGEDGRLFALAAQLERTEAWRRERPVAAGRDQ